MPSPTVVLEFWRDSDGELMGLETWALAELPHAGAVVTINSLDDPPVPLRVRVVECYPFDEVDGVLRRAKIHVEPMGS